MQTQPEKNQYLSAASSYAALNDKETAFFWLGKAHDEHDSWFGSIFTNEFPWERYLHDPEFRALLGQWGYGFDSFLWYENE